MNSLPVTNRIFENGFIWLTLDILSHTLLASILKCKLFADKIDARGSLTRCITFTFCVGSSTKLVIHCTGIRIVFMTLTLDDLQRCSMSSVVGNGHLPRILQTELDGCLNTL